MGKSTDEFGPIAETLRKAAATLRGAGIPFLLGGSLAMWARGGKETTNDLDLMVKPHDAEAAAESLVASGMRRGQAPEEWLLKVYDGDVLVDLIFRPAGLGEIDDDVIARGEDLEVAAVRMRVMSIEDVLTTKLFALGEHYLDYEPLLQAARALREKIDWDSLRDRTAGNPYAAAFFTLVEELGIVAGDAGARPSRQRGEVEVRAVDGVASGGTRPGIGPPADALR
jgi:hypothetical protein